MMVGEGKKHDSGGLSLPEDIIFDVLARLPAKALCRFRCVCKGWRALISDPAFVAAQRSRAGPYLVGFIYGPSGLSPKVRVMDMEGNAIRAFEVRVLRKDDEDDNDMNILGAATRLNLIVCDNNGVFVDLAAGRASESTTRLATPSFGRTVVSGTFKLMCLKDALPSQICKVATIVQGSAEPLAWRQRSAPPFRTSSKYKTRVTINGVIYFMAHIAKYDHYFVTETSGSNNCIAAFDLESEEWKIINGPTLGVQAQTWQVTLTELNGTLGVVHCVRNHAIIWLLIDSDKSVWVKEYSIQMPRIWTFVKLLGALDDGTILLLVRDMEKVTKQEETTYRSRGALVFYNPDTKTFTKFMDIGLGFPADTLVLYTGSLLS